MAVLADGTKATIDQAVSRSFAGDLIVENSQRRATKQGDPGARRAGGAPGAGRGERHADRLHASGACAGARSNATITAIDPSTFARVYRVEWKQGSNATLLALGEHGGTVADQGLRRTPTT